MILLLIFLILILIYVLENILKNRNHIDLSDLWIFIQA